MTSTPKDILDVGLGLIRDKITAAEKVAKLAAA